MIERWYYGKDGNVTLKGGRVLGQWHDGEKVLVPVAEEGRQWLIENEFRLSY